MVKTALTTSRKNYWQNRKAVFYKAIKSYHYAKLSFATPFTILYIINFKIRIYQILQCQLIIFFFIVTVTMPVGNTIPQHRNFHNEKKPKKN